MGLGLLFYIFLGFRKFLCLAMMPKKLHPRLVQVQQRAEGAKALKGSKFARGFRVLG